MIVAEENIYTAQRETEHGWNGFKNFTVMRRKQESDLITSFYLKPSDGTAIPVFKAGQYLTVRVPDEDSTTMRNYSISSSDQWNEYRISVKREDAQHAENQDGLVSHYLHEQIAIGDKVEIAPPCGDFFLKETTTNNPVLFIAGGIGITPLLSMLHAIDKRTPTTFIQCSINGTHQAFRTELKELAKEKTTNLHFRFSQPSEQDILAKNHHSSGFTTAEFLKEYLTSETDVYFCGPKPMMIAVNKALVALGHPTEKINFEFFGPQEELNTPALAICPFSSNH